MLVNIWLLDSAEGVYFGLPVDVEACKRDYNGYVDKYFARVAEEGRKRLAAKKARAANKPKKVSDKDFQTCMKAVKHSSEYPSKADIHYILDLKTFVEPKGNKWKFIIKGGADLMNAFGNMVPHRYHCEIVKGTITHFEMFPG